MQKCFSRGYRIGKMAKFEVRHLLFYWKYLVEIFTSCYKVLLWTKRGGRTSIMTVVIAETPSEKDVSGDLGQAKIQNFHFHSIITQKYYCVIFYQNSTSQTFKIVDFTFSLFQAPPCPLDSQTKSTPKSKKQIKITSEQLGAIFQLKTQCLEGLLRAWNGGVSQE